jgi:purine-binding chemotaxis protein CheW
VLVFDDEENEERFGLMVDGVGGVIAVGPNALEANPNGLDARSQELFDGTYKLQSGLMVRLDPQRLRPSRLAQSGLFGSESGPPVRWKQERQGEQR